MNNFDFFSYGLSAFRACTKKKPKQKPTRTKPNQLVALESFATAGTRNLAFLLTAEVLTQYHFQGEGSVVRPLFCYGIC